MSVEPDKFLPRLTVALKKALSEKDIATRSFVDTCEEVLPVFDHLGRVFQFAKSEFAEKNNSLREVSGSLVTLVAIVEEDEKNGTVTKKGSCARNLHRLMSAIIFIQTLMRELTRDSDVQLRDAAATAYDIALAPIHTKIVKGLVMAGLLTLPTRECFLASIGETEDSARAVAAELIPLVDHIVENIKSLYKEPMPASNTWFVST